MKIHAAFRVFLPFVFSISMVACNGTTPATDDSNSDPVAVDPLEDFYGKYITECVDFGGGLYNQLFANPASNGQIKLALLTWTNVNCTGTYSLSNMNGDPVSAPEHTSDFAMEDVSGIPDHFYVLKTTNLDASVTYSIFYLDDDDLYVLNDFSTTHATWTAWLAEDDVTEFADDPAGYTPVVKGKIHLMKSDLPNPLEALYGNWLSDCVDFGGGTVNQIFASLQDGEARNALLTWTDPGCTGTYSLSDINGNPVSEPVHSQDISLENVTGTPDHFYVAKVINLSDDSIGYAVFAHDTDEFYEVVPYGTPHETWADWLLEDDVTDFAADPAGDTPATHLKFHFTRSDLPPI